MADIIPGSGLQDFVLNTVKQLQSGELPAYTDPAPPADLGSPLTQAQIDQMKILLNELANRYAPPPEL